MSNLYALLIGVDFYFGHQLPGGGYYPKLAGCVRDIQHVETYLTDPARLGLAPNHILKLTASNTGGTAPAEPPTQWPTYENMVAQFKALTAMAQPGDEVYIHYSGHGGRGVTIYLDLKGPNGLDEALVPLDIGDPNARYLRDVEINSLLKTMVDKGLVATVVLDSCHSGGATRGLGNTAVRGIEGIDTTPRPSDSLVASPAELTAAWLGSVATTGAVEATGLGGATRSAKPASGWLLEPQGYTLLAACRASELAYEAAFNGAERNGALTYWLLDTLRQAGPNTSYKMAQDRIVARVHGQFAEQTPMLQGEGDRRVFGSDVIKPIYAVAILQADNTARRVQLNAGEAHGIQLGAQFAVYPPGADLSQVTLSHVEGRLAVLEADQVNAVDCWTNIVQDDGRGPVEAGAQAVLLQASSVQLQRTVGLVIADPALRQQMEATIQSDGKGFLTLANAGAGAQVDFQVAINTQQEFELWDPAGVALPNLRPAIRTDAPDAAAAVVKRLVHLAKYRNVQSLEAPAGSLSQTLKVELVTSAANMGGAPVVKPGDKVTLRITNLQNAGSQTDDPAQILNITVLDLSSDWSITQIYPAETGAFEPLDPGAAIPLEFVAGLPEGYVDGVDILKVFATRATTQFKWLELSALDQPPVAHATRNVITDPLEQMLASITGEGTTTRSLQLSAPPVDHAWTVTQVELRVGGVGLMGIALEALSGRKPPGNALPLQTNGTSR